MPDFGAQGRISPPSRFQMLHRAPNHPLDFDTAVGTLVESAEAGSIRNVDLQTRSKIKRYSNELAHRGRLLSEWRPVPNT